MANPNLQTKTDSAYYSRARSWPTRFDIRQGARVLDIGCGRGTLGEYLQERHDAKVTGLEIVEENYRIAATVLERCHLGDFESVDPAQLGKGYDYVVFSDSLEHMVDTARVLEKVKGLLVPGGQVLLSMPNVRNFRVTLPLLLGDKWEYQDEGLLDRTHLRFFTGTSICNTLAACGYRVERMLVDLPLSSKVGILNLLTLGLLRRHLTSHYFIQACLAKY